MIFEEFCNMVRNQFNKSIKILRTDNGTEYTNSDFQMTLRKLGIIHQTTCPGTPQQNGISERKNRHLLEMTRALLFAGNLPKPFWADAVLTSCYLINRLPSRILDYKSPLEILYNRNINISHLRVFGCVCYVHIQNGNKLEPRARKCVFLGYSSVKKGYKCFDPESNRTFISRDVQFTETQLYYSTNQGEDYSDLTDQIPVPINPDVDVPAAQTNRRPITRPQLIEEGPTEGEPDLVDEPIEHGVDRELIQPRSQYTDLNSHPGRGTKN
jgi:hypothetical protein